VAASDFQGLMQISQMLAKSSLVPAAYRNKPENVLLAALAGQPFGWDPTMAMRSFHVIEGQPSLKPEIMLALVRRAGHSVSGDTSPTGATITGKRRDSGDQMTVEFTLEDAKRAGLLGRRGPWQSYPQSMCWARALSQLCRMLFPDVVLGAGYTPEELGAAVDVTGDVVDDSQPAAGFSRFDVEAEELVTASEAKKTLVELCGGDVDMAKAVWGDRGSASISADDLAELFKDCATQVQRARIDSDIRKMPSVTEVASIEDAAGSEGADY
jgi:hypothetical protein